MILERLAERSEIFCSRNYHPDEAALLNLPEIHAFDSAVLLSPPKSKPYQVFTPFYRWALKQAIEGVTEPNWRGVGGGVLEGGVSQEKLELLPKIGWDSEFYRAWKPTRAGGERLLHAMKKNAFAYASKRDRLDVEGTSRLSPYLRFGQLGPREVLAHFSKTSPFARQLFWREFALHTLFRNPTMHSRPLRAIYKDFPWEKNARALRAWQRGETGVRLVDAAMRQLWRTGWMHNRARMVVASFLTKHLGVDWRAGAAWFAETLVDADLANNVFGWQWVAGCGFDAAPYFRVFNPELQQKKFDPQNHYCEKWLQGASVRTPVIGVAEGRASALARWKDFRKGCS